MEKIKIEDSVGMMVPHDMTRIAPGEFKGVEFKKGHVIKKEDIPILKDMGKEHIYILEMPLNHVHEMEGAQRLARAVAGNNVYLADPREGRVNIKAISKGIVKINEKALVKVNMIDGISVASKANNSIAYADKNVIGAKITPLTIEESKLTEVEDIIDKYGKIVDVLPLKNLKIGCIITGNEVYHGRIEDKFETVFRRKAREYSGEIIDVDFVEDNSEKICQAVLQMQEKGAELIFTSGGMSIDPDDVTPEGVQKAGANLISYGSPVFPGAMFMLAYLGDIPILGIPAASIFHEKTILDYTFPRILAEEKLNSQDIAALGNGGLL